ncbi:MAG: vitamin K epoxide reductase family protein, partial [Cyanobacteria bacterium J06641_5]
PILGALATAGFVLNAYLTISTLANTDVACPVEGCDIVLNSPYAQLFGIPLSAFGALAYAGMAVFALVPLAISLPDRKQQRTLEDTSWWLLLFGGTAMACFSGYLMYLLAFEIKSICIYCFASALFSALLFLGALFGHSWEDGGDALFRSAVVAMVTGVAVLGVYNFQKDPEAWASRDSNPVLARIQTVSGSSEVALARHLTAIGAKKFGAFWCNHCHAQQDLFGRAAFGEIDYVECDPGGTNPQTSLCQSVGVQSYPTWDINGQLYSGAQELTRLADISGYQGPRDFARTLSSHSQ